ncbi:hypothetical protein HPP92_009868 [Vanilla planifolia]|uniref:Calponin-homology (CH) domain-containing protein n=1 Tax=Vanilla planifolia TaxID=51239 RepID=A0A835RBD7_VANPL|nr:hypothetical protein HPP92_009868 [Vanilla planifolia]
MGSMSPTDAIAKRRFMAIEWLNSIFLGLNIPVDSSEEELRLQLFDGTILCGIMNKQDPVAIANQLGAYMSSEQRREKVERFLSAVEEMGVPQFSATDLEHGPISAVVDCLLSLRDHLSSIDGGSDINGTAQFGNHPKKSGISLEGERMLFNLHVPKMGKVLQFLKRVRKDTFQDQDLNLFCKTLLPLINQLLHCGMLDISFMKFSN